MVDAYEARGTCGRCLHNSVIASLLGFILVLIGGGAFGGATIFARRYLVDLVKAPNLCPSLDYIIYGLIGAIGLFTVLAYVLCTLSSGWNARHCFESSAKSACGRCCNMSFIVLLVCAIILWTAMASLVSYPVVSISLLLHRNERVNQNAILPAHTDAIDLANRMFPGGQPPELPSSPEWLRFNQRSLQPVTYQSYSGLQKETRQRNKRQIDQWSDTLDSRQPSDLVNAVNAVPAIETNELNKMSESLQPGRDLIDRTSLVPPKAVEKLAKNALQTGKEILACSANMIDLSYYGLYDEYNKPIIIDKATLDEGIRNVLICVCISLAGIFLLLLGYLQIVICTAMNYARFQEKRYYEASDAGEEGVALQQ